jgi:hypothetical protein
MSLINRINSNYSTILLLLLSVVLHSWTIIIYASDYLTNPAPTICFPIISDFLWMIFNNHYPSDSGRGYFKNQYDIIVSVYLTVLILYFLFNRSSAIKSVAVLYIYFLVWYVLFCLLSLFGLLGYSTNTTNQFDNIGYLAYYFEAVLYSKDWLVMYAVTIGWWMSLIITIILGKKINVKFLD